MAYSQSKIGRAMLRAQSDWNTPVSAATFTGTTDLLECEVFVPGLTEEALRTEAFRGGWHAHRAQGGSRKGVEISINMPFHGWASGSAIAGNPTSTAPEQLILGSVLGSHVTGGYASLVLDPQTSGGNVVDVADSSNLPVGQAALFPLSGSGSGYTIGWIAAKDSTSVTLISPPAAAVDEVGTIYGSAVACLSTKAEMTPFSMLWVGANGERILLSDGACSQATLTMSPGAQPMLSATLVFGAWSIPETGSLPKYTYPFPQAPAALGRNGARVVMSGSSMPMTSVEISIENTLVEAGDFAGPEGIAAYISAERSVSISLTTVQPDIANLYKTGDLTGTIQIDLATATPGQCLSILIPEAQVEEMEALSDSDELIGSTLSLAPAYYTGDASTTEPAGTEFRVAWL